MKKILRNVMAALLVLPLLVSVFGVATVNADETGTADVTLHKLVYDETALNETENDGVTDNGFTGTPLAGAEFTAYDVTEIYRTRMATQSGDSLKDKQRAVIASIQDDYTPFAPEVATQVGIPLTTGANGQVTFADLDLKDTDGTTDKVYVFVETKTPNTVSITTKSVPVVVAMPIYTAYESTGEAAGTINRNIQLYPKNIKMFDTKEFDNNVGATQAEINGEPYYNVTTGDELPFDVTLFIPTDIAQKDSYVLTDTPSEGLAYISDSLSIATFLASADLEAGVDYTLTEVGNGFSLALNTNSAKVHQLAGRGIVVSYKMQLTADVNPDDLQENKAQVHVNNVPQKEMITRPKPPRDPEDPTDPDEPNDPNDPKDPQDPNDPNDPEDPNDPNKPEDPENPTPPVQFGTGGRKFVKQDSQTADALDDAGFVVKNAAGEFATFELNDADEYVFVSWVTDKADATEVVSGTKAKGTFWLKGLKNGDYNLEEVTAPDGYVLNTADVAFTVTHGNYEEQELQSVPNTPKGLLPSTGGNGIYAFLAVGAVLMIGSYIWFKRSKVQAEV